MVTGGERSGDRSGVDRPPTDDTTPVLAPSGHSPQGLCDRRHSSAKTRLRQPSCQQLSIRTFGLIG
jgi:hypothetical protein